MIIDYSIRSKYLPTERQIWLMSSEMMKDGLTPTMQVMRAMEKGELKYVKGKDGEKGTMYKLCRDCLEYFPLEKFYPNKRYVLDTGYICKACTARRRRIKKYGCVSYMSEVGMGQSLNDDFCIALQEGSKEKLLKKVEESEST